MYFATCADKNVVYGQLWDAHVPTVINDIASVRFALFFAPIGPGAAPGRKAFSRTLIRLKGGPSVHPCSTIFGSKSVTGTKRRSRNLYLRRFQNKQLDPRHVASRIPVPRWMHAYSFFFPLITTYYWRFLRERKEIAGKYDRQIQSGKTLISKFSIVGRNNRTRHPPSPRINLPR